MTSLKLLIGSLALLTVAFCKTPSEFDFPPVRLHLLDLHTVNLLTLLFVQESNLNLTPLNERQFYRQYEERCYKLVGASSGIPRILPSCAAS